MKTLLILLYMTASSNVPVQPDTLTVDQTEINKQIAMDFYHDLWFTNNTDNYAQYVADEYVVHDIGDRKGVTEPAIQQKHIADFFHEHSNSTFKVDFQIAEGDLVATRWTASFEPNSFLGRIMFGSGDVAIINVFRIVDGKIVEFWNHRHDIDTRRTLKFTLQGLLIGLFIALIPTFLYFRQRRKMKVMQVN